MNYDNLSIDNYCEYDNTAVHNSIRILWTDFTNSEHSPLSSPNTKKKGKVIMRIHSIKNWRIKYFV